MKNTSLIFLFIIIPISVFSQWRFYQENDPFDGKYKVAYVRGSGNDYPYNDPTLYLRKYSDDKHFEMYIDDAGYFPDGATIRLSFSNGKDFTNYGGASKDRSAVFFKNEPYDILDALTKSSKVTIRVTTDYGSNTMNFSLSGSSKAIKYVIPNLSNIIEDLNRKEQIELENKRKLQIELDALENQFNKNYDLLKKSIKEKLIRLGNSKDISDQVILNLDFKNDKKSNYYRYNESNEFENSFNDLMKSKDLTFKDIEIYKKTNFFSHNNCDVNLIAIDIMVYDLNGKKTSKFTCTNFNNNYLNEITNFSYCEFTNDYKHSIKLDNSFECNKGAFEECSLTNELEKITFMNITYGFYEIYNRDDIQTMKMLHSTYKQKKFEYFDNYFLKKLSKKLKKYDKKNIIIKEYENQNSSQTLSYKDEFKSYIIFTFPNLSKYDSKILIYEYSNSTAKDRVDHVIDQLLN